MKMIVKLMMCGGSGDDPLIEIQTPEMRTVPMVGDAIEYPSDDNGRRVMGRVSSRVFRVLPYHCEIDVITQPVE